MPMNIKFFVKDCKNKSRFFELPRKITIYELNEKVRQIIGKSKLKERYVYESRNMDFSKILDDYNLKEYGTIQLLYRLLG